MQLPPGIAVPGSGKLVDEAMLSVVVSKGVVLGIGVVVGIGVVGVVVGIGVVVGLDTMVALVIELGFIPRLILKTKSFTETSTLFAFCFFGLPGVHFNKDLSKLTLLVS